MIEAYFNIGKNTLHAVLYYSDKIPEGKTNRAKIVFNSNNHELLTAN